MASAGLLKIFHSGMQDERLQPKGQPRTDVFQKAFLKNGRFTTEWYRVDFDNRPNFGTTARATIPRRGHLITRAYLVTQMPDLWAAQQRARAYCTQQGLAFAGPTFGWTNSIGHALIQEAQLTIAGSPISTLDGRLMEMMDEFNVPLEKTTTTNRLIGRKDNGFTPHSNLGTSAQTYVTPLPFWFARGDPSLALPIDAIGQDQVQIQIAFQPVGNLYTTTSRVKIQGQIQQPLLPNAPFYSLAPMGQPGLQVFGLNGNPDKSVLANVIPGITMPGSYQLGAETYLLLEYVYLDKAEANLLRVGDLSYPISQHYFTNPFNTKGQISAQIPMRVPNPTKHIYFYLNRNEAQTLNAPFLATRDLSGLPLADLSGVGPGAPWWPDASGLNTQEFLPLVPAFSKIDSEPISSFALIYEGRIVRYSTDDPAFFRSILPSFEQRKTPWHNKYYYVIPFATQTEFLGISQHAGEANMDKLTNIYLQVNLKPYRGTILASQVPSYTLYIWAETYNVLRVYGGRAGLLFKY